MFKKNDKNENLFLLPNRCNKRHHSQNSNESFEKKTTLQQMHETLDTIEANKKFQYSFRFGTSNKLIQLTQQQLERIPWLSCIVTHKDDFSTIQNDYGEYVLNTRIRYNWFIPILHWVTLERPSVLFTELSQDANVLSMLKLYDYLCIDPLPVPLLKCQHLARSNFIDIKDEKKSVEYHRANILEARDMAVQFIVALSRNEYKLDDYETIQCVFSLVMIIMSNLNVFSARLCHHTFTIVKQYCFMFFSHHQRYQLYNAEQSVQRNMTESSINVCQDTQVLPENFENVFAWKGVYVLTKEHNNTDLKWIYRGESINYHSFLPKSLVLNYERYRLWRRYPILKSIYLDGLISYYKNNIFYDIPIIKYRGLRLNLEGIDKRTRCRRWLSLLS